MTTAKYDLEERLLAYSVEIIKIVEQLPKTRVGNHVAGQLLRSGTSSYLNCNLRSEATSLFDVHRWTFDLPKADKCLLAHGDLDVENVLVSTFGVMMRG
jgi:hypothetical protein